METLQTLSKTGYKPWKAFQPDVPSIEYDYYAESKHGLAVSEEEYWEKYYEDEFNYEWNNGYLEVKPMSTNEGAQLFRWFLKILDNFIENFPVGNIICSEIGFTLKTRFKKSVRKPDIAVILNTNPVSFPLKDFSYSGTCDLCIECLSYSTSMEIKRDTVYKKKEYELTGVKEYYILDDRGLETAFYKLDKSGTYKKLNPIQDDIIRSSVIPGFQFRISDMYRRPSLAEMAEDEVYNSYIAPFYQDEKKRTEKNKMLAEQEKQRADMNENLLKKAEQENQILLEKIRKLEAS